MKYSFDSHTIFYITDAEAPVISNLPSDIVQDSPVVTWTAPTASDNSGLVMLTSSNEPGSSFPNGETTVSYTATDLSNNMAVETFTVTVTGGIRTIIFESVKMRPLDY